MRLTSAAVLDDRTLSESIRSMTDKEFAALEKVVATYNVEQRAKTGTEDERKKAQKLLDAMDDWQARRENNASKRVVES